MFHPPFPSSQPHDSSAHLSSGHLITSVRPNLTWATTLVPAAQPSQLSYLPCLPGPDPVVR